MCFDVGGTERARFVTTGQLLVGLTSTDLSLGNGAVVSNDSFNAASASTNASVMGMSITAGSYGALYSSKTGTGTYLAMTFFTSATERLRILTSGQLLSGLTSTDLSLGNGAVVSNDSFNAATAATNASVMGMAVTAGSYGSLYSSKTGSGTYLPMTFFTSATERMRIDTSGNVGIAVTTMANLVQIGTMPVPSITSYGLAVAAQNSGLNGIQVQCNGANAVGILAYNNATSGHAVNTGILLAYNNGPQTLQFGWDGSVLLGQNGTDVSSYSIVAAQSINVASATTNASLIGMFVTAGSRAGFYSGRSTGSGSYLDMTFDTSGVERLRILASGQLLTGLTSTDLSLGVGAIVSADTVNVATASANASVCGIFANSSRAGLYSSHSGSGTTRPMCFDVASAERMRITTGGLVYINRTTDDGTGATVQINGSLSINGTLVTVP